MMKFSGKRLLTHLISLGLGLGVAVLLKRGDAGRESVADSSAVAEASGRNGEMIPGRKDRASEVSDGKATVKASGGKDDFAGAWKEIANRDLTINERLEMQIKVLRQWAHADLESAMRAALDNAWDGGTEKGGVGPLMAAFDEAFAERPLEAWDLLKSGRLGLGAALFERQWIDSASEEDPQFVFSVAREISANNRQHAIERAMRSAAKDPEMKDAMIRKLIELPDFESANNYIGIAFNALPANEGNAAEVRGRLSAATNDRAKTVLLHEYTSTLREASAAVIRSEWSQLDDDLKKRAAVAFFNGQQGTRNAPAVLDMLIKTEQWDVLREGQGKLAEYGRITTDPRGLAEWALSLPDRGETAGMFHRSIEPYVIRNNPEAREWVAMLPPDDRRTEMVLQVFASNALYARNDEALFQWTVGLMANERQKEGMLREHEDWLKKRGGH